VINVAPGSGCTAACACQKNLNTFRSDDVLDVRRFCAGLYAGMSKKLGDEYSTPGLFDKTTADYDAKSTRSPGHNNIEIILFIQLITRTIWSNLWHFWTHC